MLTSHMALRSYHVESCSHQHRFAQLVFPISGSMEIEIGRRFCMVNHNTGVYIAPNEQHCFAGSRENLFLVVDVAAEDILFGTKAVSPILDLSSSAKKFIQFVHHYLSHHERDVYMDALVNQLLFMFSSRTDVCDRDQKVLNATHWIDSNLAASIDVDQVARNCHLSTSQLQRRFKHDTGYSIAEYWRIKKLNHAKNLLSKGNLSIQEIAYQIGYENLSAFSRRFSQFFGESPSQWQQKVLTAKQMRDTDK